MGDFNWITPQFLAFASPQHKPVAIVPETSPDYGALPKSVADVQASKVLPVAFNNILTNLSDRNVGLVVKMSLRKSWQPSCHQHQQRVLVIGIV